MLLVLDAAAILVRHSWAALMREFERMPGPKNPPNNRCVDGQKVPPAATGKALCIAPGLPGGLRTIEIEGIGVRLVAWVRRRR